jgi:hypothetical protein
LTQAQGEDQLEAESVTDNEKLLVLDDQPDLLDMTHIELISRLLPACEWQLPFSGPLQQVKKQ